MTEGPPRSSRRSAQGVQQDQSREHATYDADADRDLPPARIRIYLVAFEGDDSFDGEQVDTDGLSVREFLPGLATDSRRRWLASRIVAAHNRLADRIEATEPD